MTGRVVLSASFRVGGMDSGRAGRLARVMLCVIYIEVSSAHHERGKRVPNLPLPRTGQDARVSCYYRGSEPETRGASQGALVPLFCGGIWPITRRTRLSLTSHISEGSGGERYATRMSLDSTHFLFTEKKTALVCLACLLFVVGRN